MHNDHFCLTFEIFMYAYMVLNLIKSVHKQVLHAVSCITGTVLLYFFLHHFTECKCDPRAHHVEVEVLRAPKGLRFLNSV